MPSVGAGIAVQLQLWEPESGQEGLRRGLPQLAWCQLPSWGVPGLPACACAVTCMLLSCVMGNPASCR